MKNVGLDLTDELGDCWRVSNVDFSASAALDGLNQHCLLSLSWPEIKPWMLRYASTSFGSSILHII